MKKILLTSLATIAACVSLNAQVIFNVKQPQNLAGNYTMNWAFGGGWGCPDLNIAANSIEEQLVFVRGTDSLGCNALTNGAAVAGKIAVVYRGACEFGVKALNAQNAGAIGVVIINNNGNPVAMGAGSQGANDTIPVVMIGTADGAKLHDAIADGSCRAFIGSKVGIFANDLGYKENLLTYPISASRPVNLAKQVGYNAIEPEINVYNFGNTAQNNVVVTATIKRTDGTVLYNETQNIATLGAGDSAEVVFPVYDVAWTSASENTLKYTITDGSPDEYPSDNEKTAAFSISNSTFSYAPVKFPEDRAIATNYVKSTDPQPIFYCTSFKEDHADAVRLKGFSFSITGSGTYDLTGEYLEIEMYEWNDPFVDLDETATFTQLKSVAFGEYTYENNDRELAVYAPTSDNIQLKAGQRYLACVKALSDSIFFGFNNSIDYNGNISKYKQPISPLRSNGTWYSGGFGSASVAAIGVHTDPINVGISDNNIDNTPVLYPMPASTFVNVPAGNTGATSAVVTVLDLNGKEVTTTFGEMVNGNLKVNTTALSNGTYMFSTSFNTGKNVTYKVIVSK